jgi:anhydro-N-acetylmuramic acid kinase
MSGSSLDGLDIAYSRMEWDGKSIKNWEILKAETYPYSELWIKRLTNLAIQDALVFAKTNIYYGYYTAELVNDFILKNAIVQLDFIASHGHTIFHDPSKRYSVQIGSGAAIAAITEKRVINDFRMTDVALGGEGAPLAPLADQYLFPGYDFYLNIGGIANLSANCSNKWVAFDIAPANQIFNFLAIQTGRNFDNEGQIAAKGKIDPELLAKLRDFSFYHDPYPKSLGNEWIKSKIIPIFIESSLSIEDQMATSVEFLAQEIKKSIVNILDRENIQKKDFKLLTSGGGTYNIFLINRLKEILSSLNIQLTVPENQIIEYKEALLMSLLGLLRLENIPNVIPSVSGAKKASINGAIYE